jgi:DNA-binding response OmpR family regulator
MTTNLLILEKNEVWSGLLMQTLSETNLKYVLYRATTLQECQEQSAYQIPDLIFLDIMNDSSGFNLLKDLIKFFHNIPVIVLSTQNNDVIGIQAIKAGAQDFISLADAEPRRITRAIRYAMIRFKTQSQLKEEALELNKMKKCFLEVQKLAKFGNWTMDIVTNDMNWSDEVFRIFGFSPNSISPSLYNYIDSVHPLDKGRVESFFEAATRDGRIHRMQHRILVAGKTIKTIALQAKVNYDETSQSILLIGGIQDITDLKFISFESF